MQTAERSVVLIKSPARIYKVIVIGDPNVGKTCLTYRFCEGKFPKTPEATIGVDFREKMLDINGESIRLQLWDTAGQERFRKSMIPHYYRNAHAVVFVFDVTRKDSFEHLSDWIVECDKYHLGVNVHKILVGNKSDLGNKRMVSEQEAQKFADKYRMPLFETSAKDSHNDDVIGIFLTIVHRLHSAKPMILSVTEYESISLSQNNASSAHSVNTCSC